MQDFVHQQYGLGLGFCGFGSFVWVWVCVGLVCGFWDSGGFWYLGLLGLGLVVLGLRFSRV